ncbi:glycoside hydrolase family 3 N-terminal domain-containing protein [Microbacterium sp. NIBRBAC000506063]|uniref:glycoside hydrolase family 3 N-terminal domain-containing protein n=1 Tax=Microbacterium sp. NIBRBAC000506063 TaxID=2734618 RepID=UPI00397F173E
MLLPPFEMAIRESGVRSVMNSYSDIDGVPTAADAQLLTGLLRERWGFEGTVVADYFSIAFLKTLHGVAEDWTDAAAAALAAGIDVELPTVKTFGPAFVAAVEEGGSTRPSWTGRWNGCCGRRRSWDCSTRSGRRCRPLWKGATSRTRRRSAAPSTWTPRKAATSPGASPRRRSCSCATTASCR